MIKKHISISSILTFALFLFFSCQPANQGEQTQEEKPNETYSRIVSLSGAITETLFALGHGDKLVGIDVTSTYPVEELSNLDRLGHVRNLNVEGVLALEPDLILVEEADADREAIQKLGEAGVKLVTLSKEESLAGALSLIKEVADLLGGGEKLDKIKAEFTQKEQALQLRTDKQTKKPKVLFIYARGKGSMMVAGKETPAATMIELAGGQNAVEDFTGFKPLSVEGLVAAQPEVLLLFESGLQSIGGWEGLATIPGVLQTPAGQNQTVIAMDGLYLLGFTPRVASAALDLADQLSKVVDSQLISQQ